MSATTSNAAPGAAWATALPRSVRAELLRLRKWFAVWITLGTWLVLSVMFGYLFTYLSYTSDDDSFASQGPSQQSLLADMMPANVPDVFLQGMPMFGSALMLVLGAITAGNGYSWGTWKTVFSQGAHRTGTVLGSVAALTTLVLATLLTSFAVDLGLSLIVAVTESQQIVWPSAGSVAQAFGVGFLVLQMWAMIGYALGTLARGPTLAVGLGLVWNLVVENLLRGVGQLLPWVESLTTFLPGTAAGSLVGSILGEDSTDTPGVLVTVTCTQAAITVAVYLLLSIAISILLVRRRDLT